MGNVYSPLYLFVQITIIIIITTVTEGTSSTTARTTILATTTDDARPIATFISSTGHITTSTADITSRTSSSSILQSTKTQQQQQQQQQQLLQQQQQQDPPPSWTIPTQERQYPNQQHLIQPHVKQFQRHGIIYKTSILSKEEFQMVQDDISSLNLHLVQETSSSVARHRIGAPLPSDCKTVKIFSNPTGRMMKLVNELVQRQGSWKDDNDDNDGESGGFHSIKLASCDIVPVEIRVYHQKGAGMELHHDDVLFSPEQIEVVFTLENSSDCITKWEELEIGGEEEGGGGHVKTKTSWKHVETEANSAIILRAGPKGARHSVSSLKYGKRVIIKLVFVEQDAVFLEKAATGGGGSSGRKTGRVISSQFAGGGNKNSKKKKKQKKNNRSK